MNIKEIVDMILSDSKLQKYRDEPIIKPTSSLPGYTPEKIKQMRSIAVNGDVYISGPYCFYRQGKFMEDYEDDFDYKGTYVQYFPTYQVMSDNVLRGYFSWRTKVRRGEIQKTSLSFAYLYVYELINLIGVKTPEEGFSKLKEFYLYYREFEPSLDMYLKRWILDFAVYYNLPTELIKEYTDSDFDNALLTVSEYEKYTDDELFSAITALSSYNPDHSKFFKEHKEMFSDVSCRVYRALSLRDKKQGRSYARKLFGSKTACIYRIFTSAVFYDTKKYTNYEYRINDINIYRCRERMWTCEKFFGSRSKNQDLGMMLKTVDFVLRHKTGYEKPIKEPVVKKYVRAIIDSEAEKYLSELKEKEKKIINIDLSKLGGIRAAADITREKLTAFDEYAENISDENIVFGSEKDKNESFDSFFDDLEKGEIPAYKSAAKDEKCESEISGIPKEDIKEIDLQPKISEKKEENPYGLDEYEFLFLHSLLYGVSFGDKLLKAGKMVSVVAESVNEKLFDFFSDTVIDFDGEKPYIIEDYIDELKGNIEK